MDWDACLRSSSIEAMNQSTSLSSNTQGEEDVWSKEAGSAASCSSSPCVIDDQLVDWFNASMCACLRVL